MPAVLLRAVVAHPFTETQIALGLFSINGNTKSPACLHGICIFVGRCIYLLKASVKAVTNDSSLGRGALLFIIFPSRPTIR